MKWLKYEENDRSVIAISNYQPDDSRHMKLRIGDIIYITDVYPGWYRGYKFTEPCVKKVFPENHVIKICPEKMPDLCSEIYSWIPYLKKSYIVMDKMSFDYIINTTDLLFTEIKNDCGSEKSKMAENHRRSILHHKDEIKRLLGLPIEYRDEKGDKISLNQISAIDLYNYHHKMMKTNRNSSSQQDFSSDDICIYMKMSSSNFEKGSIEDSTQMEVIISLYRNDEKRVVRISEPYKERFRVTNCQADLVKTPAVVFKDIQIYQGHKVFLGLQFVREGYMRKKREMEASYRRPKGVAVLDISSTINNEEGRDLRNIGIQLFSGVKEDTTMEQQIHQLIQEYRVNRQKATSSISVQLKLIKPEEITERMIQMVGLNPNFPIPIKTNRNCLYLTLHHCEVDRGKKKTDPNLEVEITLRDIRGKLVKTPEVNWRRFDQVKSVVYYHSQKPYWVESFVVPLFPTYADFPKSVHFRFVIWHRSLNTEKKNYKNPIGVAHLNLFPIINSSALVENREHENFHRLNILKMDYIKIENCDYLSYDDDPYGSGEHLLTSDVGKSKKGKEKAPDYLFVQTLLCSNEFTTNSLLANMCCEQEIAPSVKKMYHRDTIVTKNIDANEIKKFSLKLLRASLKLLHESDEESQLGRNILMLMGEIFKVIKNYPEYQDLINNFINNFVDFDVHEKILNELIKNTDTIILKTADWFMKIVVRSHLLAKNKASWSPQRETAFINLCDTYLHNLENLSRDRKEPVKRSEVLKQAGPILNALNNVFKGHMIAQLVNHLLENSSDLETIVTSELTMDVVKWPLFMDPKCRQIILPRTTDNIINMFHSQMLRYFQSRELDHDHLLDNICSKMINFTLAHKKNWDLHTNEEDKNSVVKQLLIENRFLRRLIETISSIFHHFDKEDIILSASQRNFTVGKNLLQRPLMVLVTIVIDCLAYMSRSLWINLKETSCYRCVVCESTNITDLYDFIIELLCLFKDCQRIGVYPHYCCQSIIECNHADKRLSGDKRLGRSASKDFFRENILAESSVIERNTLPQPWIEMLFVQTREFLSSLDRIEIVLITPIIIQNLRHTTDGASSNICNCHPSVTMQNELIINFALTLNSIILQPYLRLEVLPGTTTIRLGDDIREFGADLIIRIWNNLETLKNTFANTFFHIFGKMTTIQNYKIRLKAAKGMIDIIHLDRETKKLELITHIDQAMEKAMDDNYCDEMTRAFKQVVQNSVYNEDFELVEQIIKQMQNIRECSQHLQDQSPINGMIVINNLRRFYQKMGRSDIISRYLMKLMSIHARVKNYSEMGHTLLELGSFYKWSNYAVDTSFFSEEYSKCKISWELKAKLLEDSLQYFDDEDWITGMDVCKELIDGYSNFEIDFVKLSEIYKKLSQYTHRMMFENRLESNFYLIFYIGDGFPKFISDLPKRSIVIRSKCCATEIEADLNSQFKDVKVKRGFPKDDDQLPKGGQKLIYYVPIKPSRSNVPPIYQNKVVKQRILKYYSTYRVHEFLYKYLVNTTEEDASKRNIDSYRIIIDGQLPSILSVALVKDISQVILSPVFHAISGLECELDNDEMLFQDFQLANEATRKTMYRKIQDGILKYFAPVAGGITKILSMVGNSNEDFQLLDNSIFRTFTLIYNFLQIYEVYDTEKNYQVLLEEFKKIRDDAAIKLDTDFEMHFNLTILMEEYQNRNQPACGRRPSIINKEEGTLRRPKPVPESFIEESSELSLRSSIISDDQLITLPRPRHGSFDRGRRQSESKANNLVSPEPTPPLPPKVSNRTSNIPRGPLPSPPKPDKPPSNI